MYVTQIKADDSSEDDDGNYGQGRRESGKFNWNGNEGNYGIIDDGNGNSAISYGFGPNSKGYISDGKGPAVTYGGYGTNPINSGDMPKELGRIFSSLFGSNSNQKGVKNSGKHATSGPFDIFESLGLFMR